MSPAVKDNAGAAHHYPARRSSTPRRNSTDALQRGGTVSGNAPGCGSCGGPVLTIGEQVGEKLFFRVRPPAGALGRMWNMRMAKPMSGHAHYAKTIPPQ